MLMILPLLTLITEKRIFLGFKSRQSLIRAGKMLQRDTFFLLLEPWCFQNINMQTVRLQKRFLRINLILLFTRMRVFDFLIYNLIRYAQHPQLAWAMSIWRITFALLYYWWTAGYFFILIFICKLFIRSLNEDAFTVVILSSTLLVHLRSININLICLVILLTWLFLQALARLF